MANSDDLIAALQAGRLDLAFIGLAATSPAGIGIHVLAQLAAYGLGVAIVPQPVASAHHKQVHTIAITRPELRGQIALAWRTEGSISPATQEFITAASEATSPTMQSSTSQGRRGSRCSRTPSTTAT